MGADAENLSGVPVVGDALHVPFGIEPPLPGSEAGAAGSPAAQTLVLDPRRLNIVNRVATGSELAGDIQFRGGVLLQGRLTGKGEVAGPLVIWGSGQLSGHWRVLGDVYLLGRLGDDADPRDTASTLECQGTVFIAASGISTGTLFASRLRMSEGATLLGPFRTLPNGQTLPVLQPSA